MNQGKSRLSSPHSFWSERDYISLRSEIQFDGYSSLEEELNANPNMRLAWNKAQDDNPRASFEDIAVYAYTLNTQFHRDLNKSLRIWRKTGYDSTYPYKNYINLLLRQVQFYPQGLELYRGISAHNHFTPNLGTVFYTNQLGSGSIDPEIGFKFTESGTLYKFNTMFAIPILDKSKFPGEQEYIIPFGMEFKVISVFNYRDNDEVHLEPQPVVIRHTLDNNLVITNSTSTIRLWKESRYNLDQLWYIQWKCLRSATTGLVLEADHSGQNLTTGPFDGSDEQYWDYSTEDKCLINHCKGMVLAPRGRGSHAYSGNYLRLKKFNGNDLGQQFDFEHI